MNDENPESILKNLYEAEEYNVSNTTPIGIEVWFDDLDEKGAEIRYQIESHNYIINDNSLIIQYDVIKGDSNIYGKELKTLIKEQYIN